MYVFCTYVDTRNWSSTSHEVDESMHGRCMYLRPNEYNMYLNINTFLFQSRYGSFSTYFLLILTNLDLGLFGNFEGGMFLVSAPLERLFRMDRLGRGSKLERGNELGRGSESVIK